MTPFPRTCSILTATVLCLAGCGEPVTESPRTTHGGPSAFGMTAGDVVHALENSGQVILHPTDTTSADCPSIGCVQAVTTDRFRILSFRGTGVAQKYAGEKALHQVENVVVSFSPPVPPDERSRIWSAVTRAVR